MIGILTLALALDRKLSESYLDGTEGPWTSFSATGADQFYVVDAGVSMVKLQVEEDAAQAEGRAER